jgi:hypothetical protein
VEECLNPCQGCSPPPLPFSVPERLLLPSMNSACSRAGADRSFVCLLLSHRRLPRRTRVLDDRLRGDSHGRRLREVAGDCRRRKQDGSRPPSLGGGTRCPASPRGRHRSAADPQMRARRNRRLVVRAVRAALRDAVPRALDRAADRACDRVPLARARHPDDRVVRPGRPAVLPDRRPARGRAVDLRARAPGRHGRLAAVVDP